MVERFLAEHPHAFPVVLTTENEMPRPFQIGVFPTYVIVDRDGNVAGAAQGDRGVRSFGEAIGGKQISGFQFGASPSAR